MNSYIKVILVIFLLVTKTSISQDNKQFEVIEYNIIVVTVGEEKRNMTAKLYIDGKESFYFFSEVKEETNIDMEKLASNYIFPTKSRVFYKNFEDNTIIYETRVFSRYLIVKDSIPKIDWKIYDEEKTIAGKYLCKKAIGRFRGRTYTAWFTEQIPISNGPWKLGGLPGLILEAYDDEKYIVFDFLSLKQTEEEINIEELNIDNPITWEEYAKLVRKKIKVFAPFMQSQMPGDAKVKLEKVTALEKSIFEDEKK